MKFVQSYGGAGDNKVSLYNGYEHRGYYKDIKGHAYFETAEMQNGRIKYNSSWFSVPVLYDLVEDEVVVTHYNGYSNLSLVREFLEQFSIGEHIFTKITGHDSIQSIPSGFYEVLHSGTPASLYAKRNKMVNEIIVGQKLQMEFVTNNIYYIYMQGKFKKVKSKSSLLELMGSRKKDIITALRKDKIKFRKNTEAALLAAVLKYNETY